MKKLILISVLAAAVSTLTACGSLMKNGEATSLAATKTTGHQYTQSLAEIEKAINEQIATMVAVTNSFANKANDEIFTSPLETSLNLHKIRYNGEFVRISDTKRDSKSYNVLEEKPKMLRFVSKRLTSPSDKTFAVYTITDHGKFRTVEAKTIEDLVVTRQSKGAVQVSIMGIGVNYNDFYDIDASLKKAYVDEKEQWQVLNRVDNATAKKLFENARAQVEGKPYETTVN